MGFWYIPPPSGGGGGGDADTAKVVQNSVIAATTINIYKVVATNGAGQLVLADNDPSKAFQTLGVAVSAGTVGVAVKFVELGPVTNATWAWDITKPIYLGSAGELTQVVPAAGKVMLVIAIPTTPTSIDVGVKVPITLA